MVTVYKSDKEYMLDNIKMSIDGMMYSIDDINRRIMRIKILEKSMNIYSEEKLNIMYDKLETAERLLYECCSMGLREDN